MVLVKEEEQFRMIKTFSGYVSLLMIIVFLSALGEMPMTGKAWASDRNLF